MTVEQVEGAKRIVANLKKLSSYANMQNNYGMAEASIFYVDPVFDLQLRVRPDFHIVPCDAFPNGVILDLKTTTDARQNTFQRKCADFLAMTYLLQCTVKASSNITKPKKDSSDERYRRLVAT